MRLSDDGSRHTRLYVSRDDGVTFGRVAAPEPAADFAAHFNHWFVITGPELHESQDAGATWRAHRLPAHCHLLETADDVLWIECGRSVLVHDGATLARRWHLPDPSPGGESERVSRLVPLDGDNGLVCTNRAQIYRARGGSAVLEPWSDGLPPPSGSATYEVARLGDIYFTGGELRRDGDPAWCSSSGGVPAWASHVAAIMAIPFSAWVAAPWARDTWIGRDAMRVLEGAGTVRERWRRSDTWTKFKPVPRAGDMSVYIGLSRATPTLGGLVVRPHIVDVVPLPAGAYDEM